MNFAMALNNGCCHGTKQRWIEIVRHVSGVLTIVMSNCLMNITFARGFESVIHSEWACGHCRVLLWAVYGFNYPFPHQNSSHILSFRSNAIVWDLFFLYSLS